MGVSMFGAYAPFGGAVRSDRFFIKVAFLLPNGTVGNYGKVYTYCIDPSVRPPMVGDLIWIEQTCITRRDEDDYSVIANSAAKDSPYGSSVLKVMDVIIADISEELPKQLEYINTVNSWVTILSYELTDRYVYKQEEEKMGYNDFMKGMFGPVGNGQCKITMEGGIAVKTSGGYKTYNATQNALINCDSFVFDGFDEMFFVVPTNDVQAGDIILAQGKPKYVLNTKDNMLTVINYDSGAVESILPERHMFMGNTYFYGKIVSMFGNAENLCGGDGANKVMKFMMMSQMMKGMNGKGSDGMNPMMMMMMMNGGGFGNMFDNIFSAAAPKTPTTTPSTGLPPVTDVKEGE